MLGVSFRSPPEVQRNEVRVKAHTVARRASASGSLPDIGDVERFVRVGPGMDTESGNYQVMRTPAVRAWDDLVTRFSVTGRSRF
jgi:hypothetical protein